MAVLVGSQQIL